MQTDSKDLNAEVLVPVLLNLELDPELASICDELLGGWDYQAHIDSQSAALFESFWWNLAMNTFQDDLPEENWPEGGSRWFEVIRNLVDQPDSQWWESRAGYGHRYASAFPSSIRA